MRARRPRRADPHIAPATHLDVDGIAVDVDDHCHVLSHCARVGRAGSDVSSDDIDALIGGGGSGGGGVGCGGSVHHASGMAMESPFASILVLE